MDAAASHIERLLKRARVRQEAPADASFLPLSLALACLLRHPPPPLSLMLASASCSLLSLADPARTSPEMVDMRLKRELSAAGDNLFEAVRVLVMYVRTIRGVLAACSDHLKRRTISGEDEACQKIISAVLHELSTGPEHATDEQEEVVTPSAPTHPPSKPLEPKTVAAPRAAVSLEVTPSSVKPPNRAVADASGVVKRAAGRDTGDGSAILDTMNKFAGDERIQTHGVRAVKGVVRSLLLSDTSKLDDHHAEANVAGDEDDGDEDTSVRRLLGAVIDRMMRFPSSLALQRDGLLCLRDVAIIDSGNPQQGCDGVRMVTAFGGVAAIVNALAQLPDDLEANCAGLAVLAHPSIADASTARVDPESRRLVLSAMRRFPLDEQVQGLGALALGNLSLRHDASLAEIVAKGGLNVVVAAMTRFTGTTLVQASGCRFLAIISAKDEQLAEACLNAGALPASEKARVRFPDDQKVQQYAVEAIHGMMPPDNDSSQSPRTENDAGCAVQ